MTSRVLEKIFNHSFEEKIIWVIFFRTIDAPATTENEGQSKKEVSLVWNSKNVSTMNGDPTSGFHSFCRLNSQFFL